MFVGLQLEEREDEVVVLLRVREKRDAWVVVARAELQGDAG